MRIEIAAVGRLKDGPERALYLRYVQRLNALGRSHALGPLELHELLESREKSEALRKDDEANRMTARIDNAATLVALDEQGITKSSREFANFLRKSRDDGKTKIIFAIGGPDGHGAAITQRASMTLSLGRMTLPHGLARVIFAEQLYRAATIIAGHPYHRT